MPLLLVNQQIVIMVEINLLHWGIVGTLIVFTLLTLFIILLDRKLVKKMVNDIKLSESSRDTSNTNNSIQNNISNAISSGTKKISKKFDMYYLINSLDDNEIIIKSNISGKIKKCSLEEWGEIKMTGNPERFSIIHI